MLQQAFWRLVVQKKVALVGKDEDPSVAVATEAALAFTQDAAEPAAATAAATTPQLTQSKSVVDDIDDEDWD
jgi:hypothetical protein